MTARTLSAEEQLAAAQTRPLTADAAPLAESADVVPAPELKETIVSNNPNAIAALATSQAALAVEAIVGRYLGAHLGPFWSQEAIAGATVVVLYVGRNGLRRALGKVAASLKSVWTGPAT